MGSDYIPSLEHRIYEFLKSSRGRPVRRPELARILKLNDEEKRALRVHLAEAEKSGQLVRLKGNRWALPGEGGTLTGRIDIHHRGFGFVTPEEGGDDVFIPKSALRNARHGDRGGRGRRRRRLDLDGGGAAVETDEAGGGRPRRPQRMGPP